METRHWGEGPRSLVLLHEGLGSVGLWRGFPRALADRTGWGVFAWSRRGYGASDPVGLPRPLDYMQREAVDVLPGVLDDAGIGDCVLVGHSDGASIAAVHAARVRDARVRGLVLIAGHWFTETMCLQSIAAAKVAYDTGDLRARLARHHRHVDVAFRGWNDAWLDPGFPRAFDLTGDLPRIGVPVLAIQGADDPYGTPEQLRAIERLVPTGPRTVLLAGARHAPHLEAPEPTLAAIAAWLGEL